MELLVGAGLFALGVLIGIFIVRSLRKEQKAGSLSDDEEYNEGEQS